MPAELSAAQITQIAQTLEANPKAQAHLNALLGITNNDLETPLAETTTAPSVQTTIRTSAPSDLNAGKKASKDSDHAKKLEVTPKADVTVSSDMLAIVKDLNIPRRVKFEVSTFVPNTSALFATLHEMERFATKKFKVRRSHLAYSPAHNALWITLLVNIQVARCMLYAKKLDDQDDADTITSFLNSFPPEKLAIPGPLMPFFQAITTYKVQNELYGRVTPCLPYNFLDSNKKNIANDPAGVIFPYLPMVADMVNHYHTDLATVTPAKHNEKFTKYYPFELADPADATKGYKANLDFAGVTYNKDPTKWTAELAAHLCNPALRYRFPYNKDLVSNLQDLLDDYEMPTIPDTDNMNSLRKLFCLDTSGWVRQFLTPMAAYAALWKGSGTLADCSLDGPPTGAHIVTYSDSTLAPKQPVMPFASTAHFNLACRIRTTQGTPEYIPENLAALTQIHCRLASDHWFTRHLSATRSRRGNVWTQTPVYGPSNEDESLLTISETLPRFLQDKLNV